MANHTILLTQAAPGQSSRTYYDFASESEAMDHIANLYEIRLARDAPNNGQVQYRAEDLFRYIDSHKEFVALVLDKETFQFTPHDKEWIKDRLIAHFSGQQSDPQYDNNNNNNRSNRRRRY